MSERAEHVENYLRKLDQAGNESTKRELFKSLLERLFNQDDRAREVIDDMSLGAEAVVEVPLPERIKTGYADTQYGRVIIEFKSDLDKDEEDAKSQLSEYIAGNWKSGEDYNFTLLATDCAEWRVYAPNHQELIGKEDISVTDVELEEVESFEIDDDQPDEAFYFLDRYLFQTRPQKPTLDRIKEDFGEHSSTFVSCLDHLKRYFEKVRDDDHVAVAFEQWQRFLSIAYGSFEAREEAFLVHTYLSVLAKLLAYEVLTGDDFIDQEELEGILRGDIFEKYNVENFVDQDFYDWVGRKEHFPHLQPVFRRLTSQIGQYDFTLVEEDILKGVYQELIDIDTRHQLGEYYTPDWLCERVVEELDIDKNSDVLDPACGSGSFLRAVIEKLKDKHPDLSARHILDRVVGVDIHPLSVQIAKTTVLLSLSDRIRSLKRPVSLKVHLSNTLLAPEGSVDMFGEEFRMMIDGEPYRITVEVFEDPSTFDAAIRTCDKLAELSAGGEDYGREMIASSLENQEEIGELSDNLVKSFHSIYLGIKRAKEAGRDSIWRFIVQNLYKPYFLKDNFDFVVGNPPWLTYGDVDYGNYQDELDELAEEYNVKPDRKKNYTHLEIASIFLSHSSWYFLDSGGEIAFVMPRSIFSGDQHDKARKGVAKGYQITELWDLGGVNPLFNIPSSVVFADQKYVNSRFPDEGVGGYLVEGRLPEQNVTWEEAKDELNFEETQWHYGKLGSLTAFTPYKVEGAGAVNYYKDHFTQGATIVPRNFYFVELDQEPPPSLDDRVISVKTNEERRKYAGQRWKPIKVSGQVNSRYLYRTAISNNVVPYSVIEPELVVLPIEGSKDGKVKMKHWEEMASEGDLETAEWFKEVDKRWKENRTDKASSKSYLEYINYRKKLTRQRINDEYLVLYTSSSKDANAAVFDRSSVELRFVVEHKTYWYATENEDEAHFLVGFLNAAEPNRLIKSFQSKGLFGHRDVHKKILEVPLNEFDSANGKHQKIAALSKSCAEEADRYLREEKDTSKRSPYHLGRLRSSVRDHLADRMEEIDRVIRSMIES
ncbi:SAM-dependent methyltransferase [Salinibacter ruber]|uniref:N-6 DNA methylase n=1 Tax=Salinibacter ruber TaxID=146919 RepID=UPI00216A24FC|nr:N-6 DNA methylase [Salinibacter ruber]MCS3856468.1 SAM-dependent methyltransferase [Salinibacter ruber]